MFTSICCSSHCKHFKLRPVPAQGEPVPRAAQYMTVICCQCRAALQMKCQSCDSTWFARAAGWTKSKSSKNFYCCKCQLLNGWDVEVSTAGTWLCSRCAAAAFASYEKDTSEATVVREQLSQGEPVPCAVQHRTLICCQCDAVLPVADCRQSCDSTWFARGAGWTKAKSSKNFYCCKCQLQNGWDMVVPTAGMWLCSRCAAVAFASYEKDTSEATVVREQPSSSSSSYVGPLASAMLAEPDSDVLHMKPLRTLDGIYSNFSSKYMLKRCSLSMQELMVLVRGKLCSKPSHWNNLPLSVNS